MDDLLQRIDGLLLEERRPGQDLQKFTPIQVEKDISIVKDLFRYTSKYYKWGSVNFYEICTVIDVPSYSSEYTTLENNFKLQLGNKYKRVVRIKEVLNPFLYVQYEVKLKQKKEQHYHVEERELYHGTKSCFVNPICVGNFDWRKQGANGMRSSKFGQGVSFSPTSSYASDYPRRYYEDPRIMMVAKVMMGAKCIGESGMLIPPLPADTSVKPGDGNVVVKYFDNEFYPEYIIYYS